MDFLMYNNIEKIHKELKSKISNVFKGKDVTFHVYKERESYNCLLPNDILTIILNMVGCLKVSFVCYQFYTVNRPFVVKCYHLHHYIPLVKNNFDKYTFNAISFDETPKIYKFKNINVDIPNNLLSLTKNTNVIDIIHGFTKDIYIKLAINSINDDNIGGGVDYELLKDLVQYADIAKIIFKYQDVIIEVLKKELTNTSCYHIYEHILSYLDEDDKNIIDSKVTEKALELFTSVESLLNIFDAVSDKIYTALFTEDDISIQGKIWSYNERKEIPHVLKKGLNFDIDITKTIFLSHYVFNNTHYNNPSLLPEYRWFEQQI